MFNPTLIATLVALPAIFAQSTNTTAATGTNSTAASSTNTNAQPSDSTAASSSTFTPTNFTPATVSGTTCGSAQQNLNQCITKVGKDISSCTDNTCLCQTYANIAACYNGCAELVDQGKQYQAQSTQYCTVAGVKPNTTATATTPTTPTPNTSTTTTTPNTTPVRTNTTANPSSNNAGTFSAAKPGAAAPGAKVSTVGLFGVLASGIMAMCL
ncbi:hypothetical protein PTTG_09281 [Puccinia triticina 1-1 BBBD Race 1]|uniref:Extracellular membrane protein CFEM domain-containing protein n=2 Tax=Puccinia triticina TaxID=208348 RepID=A0A180GLI9_PUCT1|nr:uncharacterized protein PtA15_12A590 [Puccinia triticina]OAV93560.1 hypothetical protein PTTG_09281 [Puccinia triticina 1-1 BBBD Race 1]WAQ90600.1 hypothetical protein PtA15_12A590 [Puccinia triticina]